MDANLFITILIAAAPALLWGVYFYNMNPRKQSFREILKIFIMGFLSIAAVYYFHKSFLNQTTDALVSLLGWQTVVLAVPLLRLFLMTIFIVAFVLLFALVQATVLHLLYKLPWRDNFRSIYKRMYNLTPLWLFFFLFIVIELVARFGFQTGFILSVAGTTIVFAVLEEYFKYIINPFLVFKRLNSIGSAMVNAMYVGLSFSFVENILFFLQARGSDDFLFIFIYRSLFTMLLHVSCSGIVGYFYGDSLFAKSLITNYEIERSEYDLLAWLRRTFGLGKKTLFQNIAISEGFLIAGAVHATFNLILHLGYNLISAVLIIAFAFFMMFLLNRKSTQTQYGMVGTAVMPEQDFENLRLQISVQQHLEEIRTARTAPGPLKG